MSKHTWSQQFIWCRCWWGDAVALTKFIMVNRQAQCEPVVPEQGLPPTGSGLNLFEPCIHPVHGRWDGELALGYFVHGWLYRAPVRASTRTPSTCLVLKTSTRWYWYLETGMPSETRYINCPARNPHHCQAAPNTLPPQTLHSSPLYPTPKPTPKPSPAQPSPAP